VQTRKRVLINAFTRALRDQFPPARAAGLMALTATREYYDATEIATRILPSVVVLTIDGDKDSREKAFQCVETFLQSMRDHFAKVGARCRCGLAVSAA
jgi:SCY1-like protein 1